MANEQKERYEDEMSLFKPVTIKNMVCKDCDYVFEEPKLVSVCEQYPEIKPSKVLYGGECEKHS